MNSIQSYLRHLNQNFNLARSHFQYLSKVSKALTIFLTIIVSIPTLGIGLAPTFIYLVNRFKPLDTHKLPPKELLIHQVATPILGVKEEEEEEELANSPPDKPAPKEETSKNATPSTTSNELETIEEDLSTALIIPTTDQDWLRKVAKGEVDGDKTDFKFICKNEAIVNAHSRILQQYRRDKKKYPNEKDDPNAHSSFNMRRTSFKMEKINEDSIHFFLDLIYKVNKTHQESDLKYALETIFVATNLGLPMIADESKSIIKKLFIDHPRLIIRALIIGYEMNSLSVLDFIYSEKKHLSNALLLNKDKLLEIKLEELHHKFFKTFEISLRHLVMAYEGGLIHFTKECENTCLVFIRAQPSLIMKAFFEYYQYAKLIDFLLSITHFYFYSHASKEDKEKLFTLFVSDPSNRGKTGLALCFEKGIHVEKSLEKSFNLLKDIKDYKPALWMLGEYYERKDLLKNACEFYAQATTQVPMATFKLATIISKENKKNESFALPFFERAAEQGLLEASFAVGEFYHKGQGCVKNLPKAILFFQEAGKNGYLKAYEILGEIYELGAPDQKISRDSELSRAYYLKAAKISPQAQYKLGRYFEYGIGGSKNGKEAYYYYELASKENIRGAADGMVRTSHAVIK